MKTQQAHNALLDEVEEKPSAPASEDHHARILQAGLLLGLLALLAFSVVIATGLGTTPIPPGTVARTILSHVPALHIRPGDQMVDTIVWQIRLPEICLAVLIGIALATAGLAFQSLLRNDLAEPYTIGVSSGASVAAGIIIVAGWTAAWGGLALPAAAFLGSVLVLILVYALARRGSYVDVRSLLLAGVVGSSFLWAVQMLLLRLAGKTDDQILQFLMGSLSSASWRENALLVGFVVVGAAVLATQVQAMNLFALGEESARQLGVETERFKTIMIVAGALLTSATVAVAGIIGFVGLIVPHIARRLCRTPDHRVVLPVSALAGAIMMLWSDTLSRLAFGGGTLPVGVVTAFLGGPFFFFLLRRQKAGNR
ncbi:MAG TPA: iron ABC transporter permease [Capsulimonadaceae bacterium]|nr:iron ABC transporter permease [Capsulimonadaceae bacterium]